jgi:DNA polymerase III epsilon subunit-like protein
MDNELLRFNNRKNLVLVDFETENLCLHGEENLPWQAAMIKSVDGKSVDHKNFFVKWHRELKVSKEAARITRFSPTDHKKKALPIEDIFPTMRDWFDKADYIIGHNILGFDIYLMRYIYSYMGEDYTPLMHKIIDTNCIAKGIKFGIFYKPEENFLEYQYKIMHTRRKGVRTSLAYLGKEFKIEHNSDNLHDAIVDLELNLKVWNQLKYQIEL